MGEEHAGHPEVGVLGRGLAAPRWPEGDRGLSPRAQTQQLVGSLRYSEVTRSLAMESGPWERPWSAGPVEAKENSQLDISKCQWFWLGV